MLRPSCEPDLGSCAVGTSCALVTRSIFGKRPLRLLLIAGLITGILGGAGPSTAQTYSLNFSKSSNRMSWRPTLPSWKLAVPVALSAAGDSTSMLTINATTSLRTTLDQRRDGDSWQDDVTLSSSVNYPILGPRASIGISASASSRSFSLVKQTNRQRSINFRFAFRPFVHGDGPFRSLRASLTPGVITARRATRANLDSTIEEKGIQYTASLSVSPDWKVAGTKVNTSLNLGKTDNTLKNNKNRNENLRLSLGYTFPRKVRTTLSFSETRSQTGVTRAVITTDPAAAVVRDTVVTSELSERRGTNVRTSVNLKVAGFDVTSNQRWSETINTNTANADQDERNRFFARDRETQTVGFDIAVKGKLASGLVGSTNLKWESSDRRRRSVAPAEGGGCRPPTRLDGSVCRDPSDDREDRNLSLSGSLDWQLGEGQSIALSGSARVNRDDNPGAPDQDRDTFTETAALRYRDQLESGLGLSVGISSTSTHRINLAASRSSENSRNRDIRLDIQTRYERLGTAITHTFEISARRTIFDFDREVNSSDLDRRSNIRRGWTMRHGLRRSLFDDLQLSVNYTFRADDFGSFVVDDGSQIVEEENADHRISLGMSYRPSPDLTFGVNYSYRLDRQWQYTYSSRGGERDLVRRDPARNIGGNLDYKPSGYTSLSLRGSRSRQRAGTFDSLTVNLSRRL